MLNIYLFFYLWFCFGEDNLIIIIIIIIIINSTVNIQYNWLETRFLSHYYWPELRFVFSNMLGGKFLVGWLSSYLSEANVGPRGPRSTQYREPMGFTNKGGSWKGREGMREQASIGARRSSQSEACSANRA